MAKQQSALYTGKGQRLVVTETDIPTPGPNELLVKVHSVAVNPVDYKIPLLGRFFEKFPRVLGWDVAGTVEQLGSGVESYVKGDRVFAFVPGFTITEATTAYGGFQQYTLINDVAVAKIPDNVSFDAASTIPLALSTAADGLYNFLKLNKPWDTPAKDEYLLVWGGASSVGQFTIQLAKAGGYTVITTASKANHTLVKELGADAVIDYKDEDVVEQIIKFTKGTLKFAFDAISDKNTIPHVLQALPKGGKVSFVQLTPETAEIESPANISYARVWAVNITNSKDLGSPLFKWVSKSLAEGKFKPNPVQLQSGGVSAVQDTFDLYQKEGISGKKFVLNP